MSVASLRATSRIAQRSAARSKWRSALISVLILLPVAAMVAATTITATVTPTPERSATHRMGTADLLVFPSAAGATAEQLRRLLPAGSRVEPLYRTEGHLLMPGTKASVTLTSLDPAGLGAGMLSLVAGRAPRQGEVAISSGVADLVQVGIGDEVEIQELGGRKVVGLVEDEFNLRARVVLQDRSVAATVPEGAANWLVGLPAGVDRSSITVGDPAAPTASTFAVTTRQEVTTVADGPSSSIIVLGGLALVEAALVASAAFAVSIRRRQRELGLLAASGAEPRHLAGTVLAESLLLGGLGVVGGAILGVAASLAASPFLDRLTERRNPTLILDPLWVGVAVVIGMLAALIAAAVPARSAARLPVSVALSGRRPPSRPARRSLVVGLALIAGAVALTALGAAIRLKSAEDSLSLLILLAGAVMGTLGFGACSPWLLERLERPAARLPLTGRIALRDTSRARSRNGPIVTALLASFAATVAVAAYTVSQNASMLATFEPWLLPGQIYIQGPGAEEAGAAAASDLDPIAGAPIPGIGSSERSMWLSLGDGSDPNGPAVFNVTVGDRDLLAALGAEAAADDLASGKVVLLTKEEDLISHVTAHIQDEDGAAIEDVRLPARDVPIGINAVDLPGAVVSSATARDLDLVPGQNERFLLRLGRPATAEDVARVGALAASHPDTWADAALPPTRAGEGFRLVILITSLLFALSVTGVAVALGEAESRPDQRTLLAIGAHPRLRRRIAAARAACLALLAGLLAIPAGLIPVWGLLSSRGAPLVVPWPEVAVALIGVPVLATVGALVLSRPIPSWSAFRDLAT